MKPIFVNENLFDLISEIMLRYNERYHDNIFEGDVIEMLLRRDGYCQKILVDILME